MHVIFLIYGMKQRVDECLADMMAQKHLLKVTSPDGKQNKGVWMQSQIRYLPFGVYEYVFPKEDLDVVLTTLEADQSGHGSLGIEQKFIFKLLRKALKAKPIPEYKKDNAYMWVKKDVAIMCIGIREDGVIEEPIGEFKGWYHEAI